MNFNEVVIDRVLRIHKYDLAGRRLWTMKNIKDFQLSLGGETVYAQDELGTNIMGFDRSKTASANWSNALLHLSAYASQMGSEKQVADGSHQLEFTRVFFLTTTDGSTLTLPHEPVAEAAGAPFKYIDKVDKQNNTIETFEQGATGTTNFSVSGSTVTLPTDKDIKAGDRFAVKMTYKVEDGMAIVDSANKFAEEGEFIIEALCYDPCDKATKRVMNIIFPSAKEDAAVEATFTNELTHPVTINATQQYCADDKTLFRVEVANEED